MFQALTSYDNSEGGAKKNKQEKKMREGWPRSPLSEILKTWNKTILFFNIKCTSYDNSVDN